MGTAMLYDDQQDDMLIEKHEQEKDSYIAGLKLEMFEKMKFYLDCDFNILLFGVGTKRGVVNTFV